MCLLKIWRKGKSKNLYQVQKEPNTISNHNASRVTNTFDTRVKIDHIYHTNPITNVKLTNKKLLIFFSVYLTESRTGGNPKCLCLEITYQRRECTLISKYRAFSTTTYNIRPLKSSNNSACLLLGGINSESSNVHYHAEH